MAVIPGYILEHRLHRGPGHMVFRGRRAWDDLAVILKCPAAQYPGPEALGRLSREYDLLRRLDGKGAPRAVSLESSDQGVALVLEDTGARPLSALLRHGPLEAAAFLDLGTAIVDALAAVHAAGLIHGLIGPDNILVDPDGTARLIDLSRASEITRVADDMTLEAAAFDAAPTFDPAYVAPEQTGRLDRPIDQRADHYALGAVFYQMLTGRPPFTGEDALELVHAHISRQPEPPHARNPRVPAVLSAIVLKLLAKAAEERYQSLKGLRADLDTCRAALRDSGRPPATLVVGARDRRERFRLPPRLYGREAEVAALQEHLARARGQAALVLVNGPAGAGKTALVRQAFRPLVAAGGLFIAGAFDAFRRNAPYAAIAAAFSHLVRGLLGGREQDLAAMRSGLEHALGGNGAVLVDLVPELEVLLGPQPPVPVLPPVETENRFNRAVLAFIQAAVSHHADGQPLVLFLDDLHWADRSSLHLLEYLLGAAPRGLLIVGTVLDGEVEGAHPLPFTLERLRARDLPVARLGVPPLDAPAVKALLAEALGATPDSVAPLAQACLDKTRGSPLFLSRFLVSLHDRGLIAYDPEANAWGWDLEAVQALDITDNVVDLMVARIRDMGPTAQRVLQRAACIGPTFDLETLSTINDIGPAATLAQLWEALREGLVVPLGDAYHHFRQSDENAPPRGVPAREARFRFQHERVHEAAYILLSAGERALRHLNIGRSLLATLPPDALDDRLFEVVDQLNRGLAHARDPALRRRIAVLNLAAARKAKATAASASALALAREGMAALHAPDVGGEGDPADPWTTDRALALDLHNEAAEAAYVVGDMATMEAMASAVIAQARDGLEAARMWELRVLRHVMAGDNPAAVAAALAGCAALGLRLPQRAGPAARLLALALMHRLARSIAAGTPRPLPADAPRRRALLHILNAAGTAVYAGRQDLLILVVTEILRQVDTLGDPDLRPFALALYASLLSALGREAAASRAAQAALAALPPPGVAKDAPLAARALYLATALGAHWHEPLRALHQRLQDCRRRGEHQGDMETAALAATTALQYGFYAGIDLPTLRQEAEGIGRADDPTFLPVARLVLRAVRNLEQPASPEEPDDPLDLGPAAHDAGLLRAGPQEGRSQLKLTQSHALVLMLAVLFGRWEEAAASAEVGRRHLALVRGTATGAVFAFYGALTAAHRRGLPRRARLRGVRRALGRFRRWAALGPANARHRLLMLQALEARLSSQGLRASELYDQAIAAAQGAGFQHEQALFHELAADFHDALGRPMMAHAYRRQAHHAYRLWGAAAKVRRMEAERPDLATDALAPPTGAAADSGGPMGQRIDLLAVMKATQAISGEIQRPALMERLLSITLATAGAQRGLLFLQGPDGWALEAEGETADGGTSGDRFALLRTRLAVGDGDAPVGSGPPFARSVFNLVSRTRETVVLRDAADEGPFTSDPDVLRRRPRSILCLPLIHQGELRGILYLENNLAAGTFTATRVQVLNMLAAQVVISLDNARLYEDLTALNRTLERQVADRTREATEKSRLLEATLENMSDGLVAYDEDGRLLVWNDRAMRLLGSAAAGVSFADRAARTPEGGVIALDDGRFIQVRRTFMPEGGQVQVFLDVTKERQREAELIKARQAAEDALRALTDTQQSLIQAEKMASLGQLVAGVAHEINTPVGITLTAASFLAERTRELGAALAGEGIRRSDLDRYVGQAAETTTLMLGNIQRAADLIQGFKQVAVDQTSGERRPFDLRAYLDEVLVSCGPMLRKTRHQVITDCPADLEVEGYPGALSQVLTNLVVNALTHAYGPDEAGTLRIAVTRPTPDTVELCFSDDGRGIPAEHRDRIFDPFFTTRRGQGGSGLGLHIVFNLVTAVLGGTVALDPPGPGGGTVFRIRFPRVAPLGAAQAALQ
ncbi:AAA family ATPase [Novispirillum sp. DQ9]|uniref:trifunctional serine/threonine-protein kinase/ATP-binding protein/sensor histidine kinase n=1 Tax=Novispirillum sp. DQ9 TaxID=3398612 RepID=UPI003C7E5613